MLLDFHLSHYYFASNFLLKYSLYQFQQNAESNAEYKGLDADHLIIEHIQVGWDWQYLHLISYQPNFPFPGEPRRQDEEEDLQGPRKDQPLHVLSLPHRGEGLFMLWEGVWH